MDGRRTVGWFGPSKKESRELAAQLARSADEQERQAKACAADIARVRRQERGSKYKDPRGVASIVGDLDADRKVLEDNAAELRQQAKDVERQSKRWF